MEITGITIPGYILKAAVNTPYSVAKFQIVYPIYFHNNTERC